MLDAMIGKILIKFIFSDIRFHHAKCRLLHRAKILIGQLAIAIHCDRAKGIPACKIRILIDFSPLGGILCRTDQINLLVCQELQRCIPAVTLHILNLPVDIVAQRLKIFYIHANIHAVLIFLMIAIHRKKSHFHNALLRPLHLRHAKESPHTTQTQKQQHDRKQQSRPTFYLSSLSAIHCSLPH